MCFGTVLSVCRAELDTRGAVLLHPHLHTRRLFILIIYLLATLGGYRQKPREEGSLFQARENSVQNEHHHGMPSLLRLETVSLTKYARFPCSHHPRGQTPYSLVRTIIYACVPIIVTSTSVGIRGGNAEKTFLLGYVDTVFLFYIMCTLFFSYHHPKGQTPILSHV